MTEFTFKQGPVMPARTWRCADGRVDGPDGEGIALGDVTNGHFLYTPGRPSIAQFGLRSDASWIKLQCNAVVGSDSHRAFAGFIEAVLIDLDRHNPKVTFTPPPNENLVRRIGQVVGVLGALYGVYFIVVNGLLADSSAGLGFGFGAGILAMSAFWIWSLAPVSSEPTSLEETKLWVLRSYGHSP